MLTRKAKEAAKRKKVLGPMISNFLFYEDDASNLEKIEYFNLKLEIRELLKDDFNRKVLVEVLLDLQKDITGDAAHRLSKLYRNLGLHLDAFDRLKSRRWEVISRGILELTQLHVDEAYGFIKKFINHRRGVIRQQAQLATVSLKHEGINYFLDTNKYRISEWQQLKLLDEIRHLEDFEPPRFRAWLTSGNKDVVLLSIRLIKFYKQNDANASLIELVKHKNSQIRIEAIECIKEFCVLEALGPLKAVYAKCNAEVKIQILDAIGQMGTEEDIEFLKIIEKKEGNFLVRSKALSAINCIAPETILPTKDLISTSDTENDLETGSIQEPSDLEMTEDLSATQTVDKEEILAPELTSEYSDASSELADCEVETAMPPQSSTPNSTGTEIPLVWKTLLDEDNENEEIFEICFMEELQDILSEANQFDGSQKEADILPLDFLPLVTETNVTRIQAKNSHPESILELEVVTDEVREDANFRLELDEMLNRIRTMAETEEISMIPHQPVEPEQESGANFQELDIQYDIVSPDEDLIPYNETQNNLKPDDNNKEQQPFAISSAAENLNNTGIPTNDVQTGEILLLPQSFVETLESREEDTTGISPEQKIPSMADTPKNGKSAKLDRVGPIEDKAEGSAAIEIAFSSIFHELFRNADTESKLILLDEILAVGDEKELQFIRSLTKSTDKRLRTKAILLSGQLQEILARREAMESQFAKELEFGAGVPERSTSKGLEPYDQETGFTATGVGLIPPEHSFLSDPVYGAKEALNMFDVEFVLTQEDIEHTETIASPREGNHTLLENILSIPVKIIEKLNG